MIRSLMTAPALVLLAAGLCMAQKEGRPTSLADHHRIIFENDKVRVTEFDGGPGTRIGMRSEADHVIYPLKGCEYKATTADGKTMSVTLKQGKVHWDRATEQSERIVGDRSCHYIQVDLKEPKSATGSRGG